SLRRFGLADDFGRQPTRRLLDWPRWRGVLGLDSLTFYKFLYPDDGFFHEYRPAPGGLTQVAVFVVDSGRVQPPVTVYIDGQPGYIYNINSNEPYTMVADSGLHNISIRTATRLVRLDGVYLKPLHKLTLSIDANHPCLDLSVQKMKPQLAPDELLALQRTLLVVDNAGLSVPTLRQGRLLRPLGGHTYSGRVAGPFRPDSVLLRDPVGLRRKFMFEPFYKYSFGPQLLKMQCFDASLLGPLNGTGGPGWLPLKGFVYTEADFRQPRAAAAVSYPGSQLAYLNNSFDTPWSTPVGQGRLELRFPAQPADATTP
ncbi:hypothetical protein, partial [Hymenobacter agri]